MIRVGDWIHVRPADMKVDAIHPTQLNKYKNRVQEPHFELIVSEHDKVVVNGRGMFWGLLDALFPDDPLPRTPVNSSLQHEPNEFLHDLNAFFQESTTPYISIMLGEIDDPYSTVGKSLAEPGAAVITCNSGLKAPDCAAIADRLGGRVVGGHWVDSKNSHSVPCVIVDEIVHIHDLGKQLVVGAVFPNSRGDNVRPLPPDTIRKGVGWPSVLDAIVRKHQDATEAAKGRIYPPLLLKFDNKFRSSEVMAREFELFMRGHQ